MNSTSIFLAASLWNRIHEWGASKSGTVQMWAFMGILIVISLVIFFWAINFRDHRSHRHSHHRHHHRERAETAAEPETEDNCGRGWFSSKRRRRRKKKRRANPTLAETGGLPEPRDPRTPPHV